MSSFLNDASNGFFSPHHSLGPKSPSREAAA